MEDTNRRYWLHRITGGSNALALAMPLLKNEYLLSIGWSDFSDDSFVDNVKARGISAINDKYRSEGWDLSRSRWNLWRFMCDMHAGDYIVVPSWGSFSVFELADDIVYSNQSIPAANLVDWGGQQVVLRDGHLYNPQNHCIDLGFYRKVKPIEIDIPRSEYASASLIARMKVRQTNACIDDLKSDILAAIEAKHTNHPINLKESILQSTVDNVLEQIKKNLDPDKFERLVEWYLESLGAKFVHTPAKNSSSTEEGDADKVAYFDKLKLVILVQVKKHDETSGDWAVKQISLFKSNNTFSDDYSTLMWVISSCDQFSDKAIELARANGVRLINGREFVQLILENGIDDLVL